MKQEEGPVEELDFLKGEVKRLRQLLRACTPPLETILKRRGFAIYKKEPSEDLLIPSPDFIDAYYGMLSRYSFRLFLRDVIKHQDFFTPHMVTKYATSQVTQTYIDLLLTMGLIENVSGGYALSKRPVKSFGETLEWYISLVLRAEFDLESTWGVKFKKHDAGGDYDVFAKFDSSVLYIEVKSSPPRQIYDSEIKAFFDRHFDLSPEITIFLMDTELRMKDKIVPMFQKELERRFPHPPEVQRMEKELFRIWDRIFIINSDESIAQNIGKVFSRYLRR